MIISSTKKDKIYNALMVGMDLGDAYIYAGLTEDEILYISEDEQSQLEYKQLVKDFEFSLLTQMNEIARKQARVGKEQATAWMLEKMFPRYSGKPTAESGEVHLHFNNVDPTVYDTVELFNPAQDEDQGNSSLETD